MVSIVSRLDIEKLIDKKAVIIEERIKNNKDLTDEKIKYIQESIERELKILHESLIQLNNKFDSIMEIKVKK